MTSTAATTNPTSTASKVVYHRVTRVLMLSRFRFMAVSARIRCRGWCG